MTTPIDPIQEKGRKGEREKGRKGERENVTLNLPFSPSPLLPFSLSPVGLQPWYPWPLSRWKWWTQPVRAERLAALRIGLSFLLLLDVLINYLPNIASFYGRGSLGEPPLYNYEWTAKKWNWSLFYNVQDHTVLTLGMIIWIIALVGLGTGTLTRLSAIVVWVLSTSFANINSSIDNAGDIVRGILLFYLMLSPCGAAWSVDAWWRGRSRALIYPWPLRLIFLQMVMIYWANGLHKIVGNDWQVGNALYFVLGDATLTRWSKAQFNLPYWLTRVMTWTVLSWEVSLPGLLIVDAILTRWSKSLFRGKEKLLAFSSLRPLLFVTLCFGVLFHLGIWISMELGFFAPYMLCMYLPLLPWEKLADRWHAKANTHT
jgi:hypothetical protein